MSRYVNDGFSGGEEEEIRDSTVDAPQAPSGCSDETDSGQISMASERSRKE